MRGRYALALPYLSTLRIPCNIAQNTRYFAASGGLLRCTKSTEACNIASRVSLFNSQWSPLGRVTNSTCLPALFSASAMRRLWS